MRFFRLVNKAERMRAAAWRLLDFAPDDEEAELTLATSYLNDESGLRDIQQKRDAVRALDRRWRKEQLEPRSKVILADLLEDVQRYNEAFEIASKAAAE